MATNRPAQTQEKLAKPEKHLPATFGFDISADSGAGMEGADASSFAIPFFVALQKLSPQCDEADAKFVEGAKGGMLFESVSGRLWDGKTGAIFLPTSYQRRFLRWGARGTSGSGFKGEMMPEDALQLRIAGKVLEQDGRMYFPLADGTINDKVCDRLVDVRNHFGLLYDEQKGALDRVLMVLGSTQIKKSKLLMSQLSAVKVQCNGKMVTPPTWANKVRVTLVPESNDKGSWFGYKFDLAGFVSDPEVYNAGKAFHQAILAGTSGTVNYSDVVTQGEGEPQYTDDKF